MWKGTLAVVAGLVVWIAIVTIAGPILRVTWAAYVAAAPTMHFTLAMKITRLAIGAVATIAAGWTAAAIARSVTPAVIAGAVLLVGFVPQHVMIWSKFPIWYHLTFLLTLIPLAWLGARIVLSDSERRARRA
jgi:hypothetical protein